MRVSSVQRNYYSSPKILKTNSTQQKRLSNQPVFSGVKGAGIGVLGGLAYLGACALIAGPLLPITATLVVASAGAGALTGNGIENAFSKKDDD